VTLRCVECDDESDDGIGWRAYLDTDNEIVIYCADCATREFES
jgi:hypothetical protein